MAGGKGRVCRLAKMEIEMVRSGALALVAATALAAACGGGSAGGDPSPTPMTGPSAVPGTGGGGGGTGPMPAGGLPTGLALPMAPEAVNLRGVVNPFGVVRWSLDRSDVGHPGIDIPVDEGTSFFAVGDGRIVSVEAATDGLPGNDVKVLLSPGATEGTGWAFIYEHVNLGASLGVGSQVSRGQVIATSATSAAFTNHFELSDLFNEFRFHQNQTCWVPQLDASERARLQSHFDNVLRTDPRFISSWQTNLREGQLPFRELLNTEKYPGGAQLCYPRGTDVRVPASSS